MVDVQQGRLVICFLGERMQENIIRIGEKWLVGQSVDYIGTVCVTGGESECGTYVRVQWRRLVLTWPKLRSGEKVQSDSNGDEKAGFRGVL